jgi:hypothetical protein
LSAFKPILAGIVYRALNPVEAHQIYLLAIDIFFAA